MAVIFSNHDAACGKREPTTGANEHKGTEFIKRHSELHRDGGVLCMCKGRNLNGPSGRVCPSSCITLLICELLTNLKYHECGKDPVG